MGFRCIDRLVCLKNVACCFCIPLLSVQYLRWSSAGLCFYLSVHLNICLFIYFFTPSCAYITLQHVSSLGAHFICLKIITRAASECIVHFECICKWVSRALVCVRSTCIWGHFGIIIRQHGASHNIYITLMSADLLFYCQEGCYVSVFTSSAVWFGPTWWMSPFSVVNLSPFSSPLPPVYSPAW